MELNSLFADPEVIKILFTVTVAVVLVGIIAVVVVYILLHMRRVWLLMRGHLPELIAQIDEPTDTLLLTADSWLDKLIQADWNVMLSQVAPPVLHALADALDKAYGPLGTVQARSPQETH